MPNSESGLLTPPNNSWAPLTFTGGFGLMTGPIYFQREGLEPGEPVRFGMRVEDKHCNALQICHGGMMATFMDIVLARGLQFDMNDMNRFMLTMSISIDYLDAARRGAWLHTRVSVPKRSQQTGFVQALIYDGQTPVARGHGIFRMRPG